ncbi:ADP-glyceromanno-heptose 6-epimerase [Sphingomonas naphthae]|uniref:ADP-L-glycero-D-manno-heptose-6-epimerase n=1 Tax=Sphingomonas naphthae TaxID=1813468 RepID=A0ABY7TSI4_9SPHN|nr:ADP-glyceromanno-heptose 6-epimerase [Sphingomonas naphthae]WCT75194.1 ADP-glyceromanno-heptose 6-epimerase [Sphingomonas naphthae]
MIVVTGAAGFIGSNIVADLEARGDGPIAVVDWFGTDERWRNLAKRRIRHFVKPEVILPFLDAHAAEIRAVIHMGAISATTERDVDRLVDLNINYTVALWDWCTKHQVPLIYASSAATYGGIETGFTDDDSLAAQQALQPLNAYGWSKKATDVIFAERVAAGEPTPPQWAGLKFFNVYGPNEYHKDDMMSVACKLHAQVTAGEKVRLFKSYRDGIADGDQRRDFVYVRDCTRSILWLLDNKFDNGVFNIGSGEARSFLDIAKALGRVMNKAVDVEYIEMPESIRDRYQYFTEAEMGKLRGMGYDAPATSLEDGVADYVFEHLGREDRYR